MTQEQALAVLKTGGNVFLTGEPGSGKTHTINQYVRYLREHGIEPAITASTGIAATHIGGSTIHSWSGIGIRRDITEYDLDHITQNEKLVRRMRDTRVLIVDEISMLSAATFGMVDAVCRAVRGEERAFGGIQVVLVGDFFQLPPISRRDDPQEDPTIFDEGKSPHEQFAYESGVWRLLNPLTCYLSEQHRQEDSDFLALLSHIRRGEIEDDDRALLETRHTTAPTRSGTTQLFSHNADVDRINERELAAVKGTSKIFQMTSRGAKNLVETLKRGCLSPETLTLKIGARIMCTRNDINRTYVNGTIGTVIGFAASGFPIIKTQTGRELVIGEETWSITEGNKVLASITQIPMRLAWSITVHKSQGMSLDAAHMDLSHCFEYGQGYVALSRVRTLAGLTLAGINERALEVHPDVLEADKRFRIHSEKVRDRIHSLSHQDRDLLHSNFIRAAGGRLTATPVVNASHSLSNSSPKNGGRGSTYEVTKELLRQKNSLEEIAQLRLMTLGTILSHVEKLAEDKKIDIPADLSHIEFDADRIEVINDALGKVLEKSGGLSLSPVKAILGDTFSFEEIRVARILFGSRN